MCVGELQTNSVVRLIQLSGTTLHFTEYFYKQYSKYLYLLFLSRVLPQTIQDYHQIDDVFCWTDQYQINILPISQVLSIQS